MVAIRAVRGRTVSPEWLNRVPSPAYDSLTTAQRREYRANNRWSYLNVTRAPEDEAPGAPTDNASLVAAAREVLHGLIADGAFGDTETEAMYLYRLTVGDHQQTGIVAEASVADYGGDMILAHEQIRTARAELLADHLVGVGHTSSPIALTFASDDNIRDLLRAGRAEHPILDWNDGTLHQTVWRLSDELAQQLQEALAPRRAYIIDGHHRAAAALAVLNRDERPARASHMLVALFPDAALQILGFNRWIQGLDAAEVSALMTQLESRYEVTLLDQAEEPARGTMCVLAAGQWRRVALGEPGPGDPLSKLDPVRLQHEILAPMLGITNAGSDARLVTMSGDKSIAIIEETVRDEGGVAFVIPPLLITDLFDVADAGQTMPPKSTYFVPKVRSGVFIRPVHDA